MTWEEINRKRLPFIRFGENLFKRMYGEIRKAYIASIVDLQTPEAITQAALGFNVDESLVRINYERFYLKTGLAFAKNIQKSYYTRLELKDLNDDILESVWYEQIMEFVKNKVGNNISGVIRTTYSDIQRITQEAVKIGIDKGWGMDKIAREISREQGAIDIWKALRIARTEVVSASNQGVKVGYEQIAGNKQKVWISTFDDRSRPDHMAMDGVRVAVNEYFELPSGNRLEFPGDPSGAAGDIINCYTGDMEIKSAIISAQQSFYSGKIREIITVGGKRLTITPNHNILTANGFVRAKDISIGDNLVCNTEKIKNRSILIRWRNNINNKKSLIKNVFHSLFIFWEIKIRPARHLDFNDDGKFMQGKIAIVNANRELSNNGKMIAKDFGQFRFKHSRAKAVLIKRFCSLNFGLDRMLSAPNRFMSFLYLSLPSSWRHFTPFKFFTIGLTSKHYPILNKMASNSTTMDAKFISELIKTYPTVIHLDKVLNVRDVDFSGHVYDFTSLSGTNIVNNIYTSNCRCGYEILVTPEY